MRRIVFIFIIVGYSICSSGQNNNKIFYVEVPENVTFLLDSIYYICTNDYIVGAGINIHNLLDLKKTSFVNGVYVFGGMGPHFQHLLFVHYNEYIYVFNSHHFRNVIRQLVDAKSKLGINRKDYIRYLRYIKRYMTKSCKLKDYYCDDEKETYQTGILVFSR